MGKETKIISWEQGFLYITELYQQLRVEFVTDRVSYIVLRGRSCNIIVLTVHAPSEDKSDDSTVSFYEELEHGFYHFPTYHMKIILGDFNAKVERERERERESFQTDNWE
jgi:hypothetical protein